MLFVKWFFLKLAGQKLLVSEPSPFWILIWNLSGLVRENYWSTRYYRNHKSNQSNSKNWCIFMQMKKKLHCRYDLEPNYQWYIGSNLYLPFWFMWMNVVFAMDILIHVTVCICWYQISEWNTLLVYRGYMYLGIMQYAKGLYNWKQ